MVRNGKAVTVGVVHHLSPSSNKANLQKSLMRKIIDLHVVYNQKALPLDLDVTRLSNNQLRQVNADATQMINRQRQLKALESAKFERNLALKMARVNKNIAMINLRGAQRQQKNVKKFM